MRKYIVLAFGLSLALCVSDSSAESADRNAAGDLIPPQVASYASQENIPIRVATTGQRVSPRPASPMAARLQEGGSGSTSIIGPVLLSALLPGAGEWYLGYHKRAVGLMVTEVAAWTGYFIYQSRGHDSRKEFEAFADAHWDFELWLDEHPASAAGFPNPLQVTFDQLEKYGREEWTGWPGYHVWAPRDEEPVNYYENIGKYDWFISGWDGWDGQSRDTTHRVEYKKLRKKSDDEITTAKRYVFLSVAARVFSVVETAILARKSAAGGEDVGANHRNVYLTARSTGFDSGQIALEYRFR